MQKISSALLMGVGSVMALVLGLSMISAVANQAAGSADRLKAAFANFTIPAPNTGAFVAVMAALVVSAMAVIPLLTMAGTQAGNGFVTGLSNTRGQAVSAMIGIVTAAASAASSGVGQFQTIGSMIGQGLAVGLQSAYGAVAAAASALVAKANEAAQAKAQILSPSHLFLDEVGWFIGAGVAQGMDNSAGLVTQSSNNLIDTAYKGADVPSQPLGAQGVSSTNNTSNNQKTFNFNGDIIVQSKGDSKADAKQILAEIENLLEQQDNGALAW